MKPNPILIELARRAQPKDIPAITPASSDAQIARELETPTPAEQVARQTPADDHGEAVAPDMPGGAARSATTSVDEAVAQAGDAGEAEGSIFDSIASTYHLLRIGLGAFAFLLPLVLVIGGAADPILDSLSAYYHYDNFRVRDFFVGILWAIGAFLFFYRGYTVEEHRLLNIAGAAAVVVALFPTSCNTEICGDRTDIWQYSVYLHNGAAIVFFVLAAWVCVFRSGDTLQLMDNEKRRARFRKCYQILGGLMIFAPVATFIATRTASQWVLYVEVAALVVFGVFWLLKSRELRIIEAQGAPC